MKTLNAEASARLLAEVAVIANASEGPADLLSTVLEPMARALGWPIAHAWLRTADQAALLVPTGQWYVAPGVETGQLTEKTRGLRCPLGVDLPGRALGSRRLESIRDPSSEEFARLSLAAMPVRSAMALPVLVDGQVAAVIEFLSYDVVEEAGQDLVSLLGKLCEQLAFVFKRRKALDAVQASIHSADVRAQSTSRFLANMSHEIRTPMNAIIGLTNLALRTNLNTKQRDYMVRVDAAAKSLLQIINDVLDLTKIEAGMMTLEAVPFSLNELIDSLASVVSIRSHEKGVWIHVYRDPSIPDMLVGDPLRLNQVFINLINNALKFTDEGEIRFTLDRIRVDASSVEFRVTVKDTGVGMAPEVAERLFEPFRQGDSSITRKYGGTGLGLSISQQILHQMGSYISVRSEPGVGSEFSFSLTMPVASGARMFPPDLEDLDALIVDDHEFALSLQRGWVEGMGYRVTTASSAEEALVAARQHSFAVVIIDRELKDMAGAELAAAIKSMPGEAPKVILTSSREIPPGEDDPALVDAVLQKPMVLSNAFDAVYHAFGYGESFGPGTRRDHSRSLWDRHLVANMRVLVVDDSDINLMVAKELLEAVPMAVETAMSGQEAVEKVTTRRFDCVLMDVHMPEMDGLAATRKIRELGLAELPIIAMTASTLAEEQQAAIDAGMNDHVSKPIDPDGLVSTLIKWVRRVDDTEPGREPAQDIGTNTLAGLDTEKGLRRVAGNRDLYARLLGSFLTDFSDLPDRMQQLLDGHRTREAGELAHKLAGVARNLSVDGVAARAEEIEAELRSGATPEPTVVTNLKSALADARESIELFLAR